MPLTANFTEGQVSLELKLSQNQINVIEKHINASLATVKPSRRRFIENFYAIETSKRPANLDQMLDKLETNRQENLNKHLEDFQNLAQLMIFDRAEGQGAENHLRFDSTRDPGSRLPEVIEQQIELLGNSKKLAENIRAILNHTVVDKLTPLTNQIYYDQTGRRVGTITFDGRQDYSLVRLTPQPAPGNQNPDEVIYELKINFQGTFEGADGGQGTVETEITVRLNHSYSSEQVNMLDPTIAKVFEAKVKYLEPTNA
jgi:transcription termination factor NusB